MTLQADGTMTRFFPCDVTDLRRQTLPPVYVLNGAIYLNRSTSLLETRSFFPDGTHAYIMPAARALDIDTPRDLLVTQLILDHYDAYLGL